MSAAAALLRRDGLARRAERSTHEPLRSYLPYTASGGWGRVLVGGEVDEVAGVTGKEGGRMRLKEADVWGTAEPQWRAVTFRGSEARCGRATPYTQSTPTVHAS